MKPRNVLKTLRLEDGRPWLNSAYEWQRADALAVLEGDCPYHFITRSRGSSKTSDLGAIALSALVAADGRLRAVWCAADADQGRLAIDVISGYVQRTPALKARVDVQARRVVVPETGAELLILPADAPSAWGMTPHWAFCDEISNWADTPSAQRLWEAVSSSVSKRDDSRMVCLTTPSTPDHFSFKILEHARVSELWRPSEREGPAPWMDEGRLAEQRSRLPHAVFEQLFMARWTQADGSFLDPIVVDQAFCLDGPRMDRLTDPDHALSALPGPFVAALDLGVVHDRSVFSVGHREGERVVLDRMQTWQGSRRQPVDFATVESFIAQAHQRFGFKLFLDPWQGLDLSQRLRSRSVPVEEYNFSSASKQRLAATLLSTINNGNLALYEAEGLRDELLALRLVQTSSGAWAFDHKRGGHDDRAVSLALMCVGLLDRPAPADYSAWLENEEHGFFSGPPRPSTNVIPGLDSGFGGGGRLPSDGWTPSPPGGAFRW